jgi:hypothetical protein
MPLCCVLDGLLILDLVVLKDLHAGFGCESFRRGNGRRHENNGKQRRRRFTAWKLPLSLL